LVVAQVFTIKSDYGLSEASYDRIVKWTRNILPEGNKLKENFYAVHDETPRFKISKN
jgi:hypothetical protein